MSVTDDTPSSGTIEEPKRRKTRAPKDISGQRFGKLTAISFVGYQSRILGAKWLCKCDCGKSVVVLNRSLKSGNTKSCGCGKAAATIARNTKHGLAKTSTYKVWQGIRARCNCPGATGYLGGRIKVFARWDDFAAFLGDMGEKPSPKHELARLDTAKDFSPENCIWRIPTVKQKEKKPPSWLRHGDLTGTRFGYAVVIGHGAKGGWGCRCDCGRIFYKARAELKAHPLASCGCKTKEVLSLRNRNRTHGMSRTPEFKTWNQMISRCTNPHPSHYLYYGRVSVCERWRNSFENFLKDMGPRPSPKHSIDRIDGGGNYEPSNCRWATRREQAQNTNRNVYIEHNGQRKCVSEWARTLRISLSMMYLRLKEGWTLPRIIAHYHPESAAS